MNSVAVLSPGERQVSGWQKAYLAAAFILVGVLSFSGGLLTNIWQEESRVELSIVSPPESLSVTTLPAVLGESTTVNAGVMKEAGQQSSASCVFVGSKNSNKYHLPSCSYAKRILEANRLCFASKEEAEKRGYSPGCLK